MKFELHPSLAKKTWIADFPLCRVTMEDEKNYPWLILVPRRPNASRLIDLSFVDQLQLLKELDFVQRKVWEEFRPTQLNVAAIGNKTPQLHLHVIARFEGDPAWPQTVWDHPVRTRLEASEKEERVRLLQRLLLMVQEPNFSLKPAAVAP
jgi:diadenosine tetraphosphate (Ap4A) HIT family hydrolase